MELAAVKGKAVVTVKASKMERQREIKAGGRKEQGGPSGAAAGGIRGGGGRAFSERRPAILEEGWGGKVESHTSGGLPVATPVVGKEKTVVQGMVPVESKQTMGVEDRCDSKRKGLDRLVGSEAGGRWWSGLGFLLWR
ncbi:hypothetical protein QJS10_CPB17g00907 [Acorus calamus]|uniref:Uncharacterized protein n=1 Tax=Acorus calamus TaxID=4465 RepID=A0AAV9CSV3_ACOCL|nr:hypothetical protein QJS10_CPB17g00907 [Acorus calamus]